METKKKSPRACGPCRKRKVKCNSELPCDRCIKNKATCVYDKPQQKKDAPKQINNHNHEARLAYLKDFLREFSKILDSNNNNNNNNSNGELAGPFYSSEAKIIHDDDKLFIRTTGQGTYVQKPYLMDIQPNTTLIHENLIKLYFDYIDPIIPIIHKPSFYYDLSINNISSLLLNAIYCVSSRWDLSTNSEDARGWHYYQEAIRLLDRDPEPSLSTIQAIFLLLKYNDQVRRPGFLYRTRYYFQLIIRIAKEIDLSMHQNHLDPVQLEVRKRTFWAIFTYDIMMSTELGTLPNFTFINCSIPFPIALEDEEQDKMTHFMLLSKLMKIQFDILQFLHKESTQEEFKKLALDVENIKQLIYQKSAQNANSYKNLFLYLTLDFIIILLYRPFLNTYADLVKQSALSIKKIVNLILNLSIESMYCSIRGIQQIIFYLSSANTVFSQLNLSLDYQFTLNLTKKLSIISPLTELHYNNKMI